MIGCRRGNGGAGRDQSKEQGRGGVRGHILSLLTKSSFLQARWGSHPLCGRVGGEPTV